jgi:hypothetical protein
LKALLGSHVFISPAFTVLERATPQGVYYTKAGVNVASREITLTGLAVSIDDALGAATKMESQEGVERVSFANAGKLVDGPWQFTMSVVMKEKFFNAAPNRAIVPIAPVASSTQATSTISTSSPR